MSGSTMPAALRRGHLIVFVAAFLATRLFHLMILPVFLDEAMHVEWALKMAQTGRLFGITDGGRYLPIWIFSRVAPHFADPLLGARLCSVAFGLGAALGLIWLGRVLYSARAGFFAALLYLVLPSTLLYDRMALVDSLLCALVIVSIGCGVRWAETGRIGWATALGVAIGCASITKLYGALLLALPVFLILLWPTTGRKALWVQLQWVHALALGLMLPIFVDLAGTFQFVAENVWAFRSGAQGHASIARNLWVALLWQVEYLTPIGFGLVVLAALHRRRTKAPADRVLWAVWAVWTLFFVVTGGQDWFPRYLLPGMVPLLLFTSDQALRLGQDLAERLGRPALRTVAPWGLVGLFALSSFRGDRALLFDPAAAPLPGIDRFHYLEDWPAGARLADVAAFLTRLGSRGPGIVVTRDLRSGPLLEGLNLLVRNAPAKIEFVDVNIRKDGLVAATRKLLEQDRPVLLAIEQPLGHPLLLSLDGRGLARPLGLFLKPGRHRLIEVYCIHGACSGQDALVDPASLTAEDVQVAKQGPTPAAPGLDRPGGLDELRVCGLEAGQESLDACHKALGIGLTWPRGADAYYSLGRNLTTLGRYAEALRAFREAMRLLPDDVDQTLAYAETLEAFGHYEEALASERDALRFAPEDANVHQRVGWNLAWLGRLGEGEAALRRSLELNAAQAGVHGDLGVVLWRQGRRDEAVVELKEALRLDGEGLRGRYNMSVVQAALAAQR